MSRTDKDRPYWVKLNDEGVMDHDHCFPVVRSSYRSGGILRDDKGDPVMEEYRDYRTAKWIADNAVRTKDYYVEVRWPETMLQSMRYTTDGDRRIRRTTGKGINPVWQEAQNLVNQGKGETKLLYSTEMRPKRRKIETVIHQECTEHLPEVSYLRKRNEYRPCSRVLPPESRYRGCSCASCRPGGIVSEQRSRTRTRSTLANMTKAANTWEDGWEDDFEERELYMTKPLRYSSDWC